MTIKGTEPTIQSNFTWDQTATGSVFDFVPRVTSVPNIQKAAACDRQMATPGGTLSWGTINNLLLLICP